MDLPDSATEHFQDLVRDFESHGFPLEISLEDIAAEAGLEGHIQAAYDEEDEDEARDLIQSALVQYIESEIEARRTRATTLQEQAKKMQNLLEQTLHMPTQGDSLSRPLGLNVNTLRRCVGMSKLAFSDLVDGISRPTLRKMENGGGGRLSMVESIAEAMGISPTLLLLGPDDVAALVEIFSVEAFINVVTSSVHHNSMEGKDMSVNNLWDVISAVEEESKRLTSRGAQAGALVGWAQGIPVPAEKTVDIHEMTNVRLQAAKAGALFGRALAENAPTLKSTDGGLDSFPV
jgi:hypothetical protein